MKARIIIEVESDEYPEPLGALENFRVALEMLLSWQWDNVMVSVERDQADEADEKLLRRLEMSAAACVTCGGTTFVRDQCMDCGRPRACAFPHCVCQPDVGCSPTFGANALPAAGSAGDE